MDMEWHAWCSKDDKVVLSIKLDQLLDFQEDDLLDLFFTKDEVIKIAAALNRLAYNLKEDPR
jgi:hypothetical protein